MKKAVLLMMFSIGMLLTFYSCSDSDSKKSETQKSLSLRVVFGELKNNINQSGRSESDSDDEMCFDFVYPITLSYNNSTTIVVNSLDELYSLLENESEDLYLEGIAFPFQIISLSEGNITTINDESDFVAVLENCGYESYDDSISDSDCFEFIFPFSLINLDNETFVINNEADLYSLFEDDSEDNEEGFDFVYPVAISLNGVSTTIENSYQLYEILDSCEDDDEDCICPADLNPVCVVDADGEIITFSNACVAECEGYSSSDFVSCN